MSNSKKKISKNGVPDPKFAALPLGIPMNTASMDQIDLELLSDGLVSSFLSKIERHVFMGGMTIKLRVGERSVPMTPAAQRYFNKYWMPELKRALRCVQKYGVFPIVYQKVKTPGGNIITLPRVPTEGTYIIRFTFDESSKHVYTLYRKQMGATMLSGFATGGAVSDGAAAFPIPGLAAAGGSAAGTFPTFAGGMTGTPMVWENSRVFEVTPPDRWGRINSVVQRIMRYVVRMNNAWDNFDSASNELARPPYVHEQRPGGAGGRQQVDGPADMPFGESDSGLSETVRKQEWNDSQRAELHAARKISAATNAQATTQIFNSSTQMQGTVVQPMPWEDRKVDLPEGISLSSAVPRPQIPGSFQAIITALISIVANALELPDQLVTQAGRKYAGTAGLAERQFNNLISSYQESMMAHIQSMFYDVYTESHRDFVESVVDVLEQDLEEFFEGEYVTDSTTGRTRIVEKMGDDRVEELSDQVQIEPVFNKQPDVTWELLKDFFVCGIIPQEEFTRIALRMHGMEDCDSCLTMRGTFVASDKRIISKLPAPSGAGSESGKSGASGGASGKKKSPSESESSKAIVQSQNTASAQKKSPSILSTTTTTTNSRKRPHEFSEKTQDANEKRSHTAEEGERVVHVTFSQQDNDTDTTTSTTTDQKEETRIHTLLASEATMDVDHTLNQEENMEYKEVEEEKQEEYEMSGNDKKSNKRLVFCFSSRSKHGSDGSSLTKRNRNEYMKMFGIVNLKALITVDETDPSQDGTYKTKTGRSRVENDEIVMKRRQNMVENLYRQNYDSLDVASGETSKNHIKTSSSSYATKKTSSQHRAVKKPDPSDDEDEEKNEASESEETSKSVKASVLFGSAHNNSTTQSTNNQSRQESMEENWDVNELLSTEQLHFAVATSVDRSMDSLVQQQLAHQTSQKNHELVHQSSDHESTAGIDGNYMVDVGGNDNNYDVTAKITEEEVELHGIQENISDLNSNHDPNERLDVSQDS
jgi:hypothetical protein